MHLKDYGGEREKRATNTREIGAGSLPFREIIAKPRGRVEWYIVEQDRNARRSVRVARAKFNYIKDHIVSESCVGHPQPE